MESTSINYDNLISGEVYPYPLKSDITIKRGDVVFATLDFTDFTLNATAFLASDTTTQTDGIYVISGGIIDNLSINSTICYLKGTFNINALNDSSTNRITNIIANWDILFKQGIILVKNQSL